VKQLSAIGLMSGTSYDGVDVALIETDGEEIGRIGPTGYRAYDDGERAALRRAIAAAVNLDDRTHRTDVLAEAEAVVTAAHADAVMTFLHANGLSAGAIDVVGFHGQTVLHRPDRRVTVQLGDGAELARRLGIPWSTIFAPPMCRRRRGRRWCRSITVRWCGCSVGGSRLPCSISAALPT
jgi:anhydro-N-acetylmuramic acid kinase